MVTAHERWFLDRVDTHMLAWEGAGDEGAQWYWFERDLDDYLWNRGARLGDDAIRCAAHRRLTRR